MLHMVKQRGQTSAARWEERRAAALNSGFINEVWVQSNHRCTFAAVKLLVVIVSVRRSPAGAATSAGASPGSGGGPSPAPPADPLAQAMGGLNFGAGGGQADMMQQMLQSPMTQVCRAGILA